MALDFRSSVGFVLILAGAMIASGCSERVDASKVAKLARGTPPAPVERQLGRRGAYVFTVEMADGKYQCVEYEVGHLDDRYLFIFRDDRLTKIVAMPAFKWSNSSELSEVPQPDYLWRRVQRVLESADVNAPPDRFPEPTTSPSTQPDEALGMAIAFAPFIIVFGPIIFPLQAIGAGTYSAHYDPSRASLGQTVGQIDAIYGKPARVWDTERSEQWRRYQSNSVSGVWPSNFCVVVFFRGGQAVGIFSDKLVDDSAGGVVDSTK